MTTLHVRFQHALLLALLSASASAQTVQTLIQGLQVPSHLTITPGGNLLVSEGGGAPNTGRISIVDSGGNRGTLIGGLPSGPAHVPVPYGPTGMALDGRTLYVVIGDLDLENPPPAFGFNLQGPSSPVFCAILKFRFSADIDQFATGLSGFALTMANHWELFDGFDLNLANGAGQSLSVQLLTKFQPIVRDGQAEYGLRVSDPYSVVLDARNQVLYVSDSAMERIWRVDSNTGRSRLVMHFPHHDRQTPDGTASVDNVPTGLVPYGDKLLVGFLSGGPFPPGEANISIVDPANGTFERAVSGLTAVTDIAYRRGPDGAEQFFALEFTTDISMRAPLGRLRLYTNGALRTLVDNLSLPTGMALNAATSEVFVATLGGTIMRVRLP